MKKKGLQLALFVSCILCMFMANAQTGYITTIAGTGTAGYSGDGGPATAARLNFNADLVKDDSGNLYFADADNNCVRKVNTAGIITTIAGVGRGGGFSGDGGPATAAHLYYPTSVKIDAAGNIIIADQDNYRVRKVDAYGIITTIAGTGSGGSGGGYTGDGGPATDARIGQPSGIALDNSGNIYISDQINSVIRKINASGIISTFAGTGSAGYSGDGGPATAAQLNNPFNVETDRYGNVYIADGYNYRIRKVNTSGIISTIAGTGTSGFSGDGGAATAAQIGNSSTYPVTGLFIGNYGDIYIADAGNNRIRKINSAGIITTIAGNGSTSYSGDGGPATAAGIYYSGYVYVDNFENIYISQFGIGVVRKIEGAPRYSSDSFTVGVVDRDCAGPELVIVPDHYLPGMFVITHFGDGAVDTTVIPGTGSSPVISHSYNYSGGYTIQHILFSGSMAIDSIHYNYEYAKCTSVPIVFYYDGNGNCVRDSGEFLMNRPTCVEIDSNGISIDTISCVSGLYYTELGLTGDIYQFKVVSPATGFSVTCPSSGIIADTVISGIYSKTPYYFGLSCNSAHLPDLGVLSSVRGTGVHAQDGDIYAFNNFCPPTNGIVTLYHSPKYGYHTASPTPASTTATSITWNVSGLSTIGDSLLTHLYYWLEVPSVRLSPGDTVHTEVVITSSGGDSDSSNNIIIRVDTVKDGYDPNQMSVSPNANVTSGGELQYTIQFENTGNDTAFNIYVMDTLSDDMDISSYKMVAAPHDMILSKIKVAGQNILRFDFPGINLLDSSHHSQCNGMVMFTINSKTGLPACHQIFNSAGIYFDANPVVITNKAAATITCPVNDKVTLLRQGTIELYPNPANSELNIKTSNTGCHSFTITNMVGQQMIQQTITSEIANVNIHMLPSGVYYVTFKGDGGSVVRKFVKD